MCACATARRRRRQARMRNGRKIDRIVAKYARIAASKKHKG